MAEQNNLHKLDFSRLDVRVRNALRKMRIETVGQLLELNERVLLSMKNCGPKTTARILQLQAEHGKDIAPAGPRRNIDEVLADSIRYTNGLVAVVSAANDIIDSSEKDKHSHYYFRVTAKRFNMLRRALEVLGGCGATMKTNFFQPDTIH